MTEVRPDGRRPARVAVIMGPTAAGKTDLAVALVARAPFEIVSVDSAMVYRGLDIGTGKPSPAVLRQAPHRLVDVRDPMEPYCAADFRHDALDAMAEICAAGRVPLLVGGTGLYFRALLEGLSPLPPAQPAVRARLEAEAAVVGWPDLHRRLAAVDAVAAARIHPNDPQRIQRALEVHAVTGLPMSLLQAGGRGGAPCITPVGVIVDAQDRGALHQDIERRFDAMLAAGLVAEVEALRARWPLRPDLPAMRAVGYRQVWDFLEGSGSRQALRDRAVAATRQLARRQLTWLRSVQDLRRVDRRSANLEAVALDALRPALEAPS